jgi:hypothetical protein
MWFLRRYFEANSIPWTVGNHFCTHHCYAGSSHSLTILQLGIAETSSNRVHGPTPVRESQLKEQSLCNVTRRGVYDARGASWNFWNIYSIISVSWRNYFYKTRVWWPSHDEIPIVCGTEETPVSASHGGIRLYLMGQYCEQNLFLLCSRKTKRKHLCCWFGF